MTQLAPALGSVLRPLMRLALAGFFVLAVSGASAGVILTTLYSFNPNDNGVNLPAWLVQGSDGYLYGVTESGGANNAGSVFRIGTNGALTTLHSFGAVTPGSPVDGAYPTAALVQGSDGYFYGTTSGGGSNGNGTVFKISTNGAFTTLYAFGAITNVFGSSVDGAYPRAALVQGSDGYFYGTTPGGGSNGVGTVFNINANGAYSSLYSFTGGNDGAYPNRLVQGSDGNFYGTTFGGGTRGGGSYNATVFRIGADGTLATLYSFTGNARPNPTGGLAQGSDGYFYGTTSDGGTNGAGSVFQISTNGVLTSVYSFTGTNDGANPQVGLVQDSNGYFYGTTSSGGTNNYGTVFKFSTSGTFTTLYAFGAATNASGSPLQGVFPEAGLVQGRDGYVYGMTTYGGTNGWGIVFRINANGTFATLYSLSVGNDGQNPQAGLVQGSDGYFYGTTEHGGTKSGGVGTVFRINPNGTFTTLYSFTGNDGANPTTALVQGSDGSFYGMTFAGGTNESGTAFKLGTNGALITLHSFGAVTNSDGLPVDGTDPIGGLVQGSDSYFYGTTENGGTNSSGTVFKLSTNGAFTTLHAFGAVTNASGHLVDGAFPAGGLVQGKSDSNFYGMTTYGGVDGWGTVFRISTDGTFATLYSFSGGNDGAVPQSELVQGRDGYLYGLTAYGGLGGRGTMFKMSANGALTTLCSFVTGGCCGNFSSGLVQDSNGDFFATMSIAGTVFKITTNGALTTLLSFPSTASGLVQGRDGSFYGTTFGDGAGGAGTVFRMTLVPEVQAVTLTDNSLRMTWGIEAGGTYQLQYNSDLSSSNWINLRTTVTAAGATLSTTDSVTNGPRRFYRLVLLP